MPEICFIGDRGKIDSETLGKRNHYQDSWEENRFQGS